MIRRLEIDPIVEREIERLPENLYKIIRAVLQSLTENPEPIGSRPLGYIPNACEIRTGTFSTKYVYDDHCVTIVTLLVNT